MAEIAINKAEAARRLIEAAIRLHFGGEDTLVIKLIIGSANNIVEDLADKRESNPLDDVWKQALNDTLAVLACDAHALTKETDLARLKKTFDEVRCIVKVPREELERVYPDWNMWRKKTARVPVNFLKHADRAPNALMEQQRFESVGDILLGCAQYCQLGFQPTAAMRAFFCWFYAVHPVDGDDKLLVGTATSEGARYVNELSPAEQVSVGQILLDYYLRDESDV